MSAKQSLHTPSTQNSSSSHLDSHAPLWHSSQATVEDSSNHIGFANEEADRLIEAGRREFDREKRIQIYHRFHRLLHELQPYTFLVERDELITQDKRFQNAKVYPLGMYMDTFWVPLAQQKYRN